MGIAGVKQLAFSSLNSPLQIEKPQNNKRSTPVPNAESYITSRYE